MRQDRLGSFFFMFNAKSVEHFPPLALSKSVEGGVRADQAHGHILIGQHRPDLYLALPIFVEVKRTRELVVKPVRLQIALTGLKC